MNAYISLSYFDVILASIFLLLNALFSILLQLRLERKLKGLWDLGSVAHRCFWPGPS